MVNMLLLTFYFPKIKDPIEKANLFFTVFQLFLKTYRYFTTKSTILIFLLALFPFVCLVWTLWMSERPEGCSFIFLAFNIMPLPSCSSMGVLRPMGAQGIQNSQLCSILSTQFLKFHRNLLPRKKQWMTAPIFIGGHPSKYRTSSKLKFSDQKGTG